MVVNLLRKKKETVVLPPPMMREDYFDKSTRNKRFEVLQRQGARHLIRWSDPQQDLTSGEWHNMYVVEWEDGSEESETLVPVAGPGAQ